MNSIARERDTRARAVKILEAEGWQVWFPIRPTAKFKFPHSRTDIFGLFDLIAIPNETDEGTDRPSLRMIQLKTNHTGRIDEKYLKAPILDRVSCEYWSYNTKKRVWTAVVLDHTRPYLKDYTHSVLKDYAK